MRILYLVRHGDVEEKYRDCFKGKLDCDLSENGKQTSLENAAFLLSQGIDLVVTTGLKRTDYLGELLSLKGIKHLKLDLFQEIDFGLCSGKTWVEIEKEFPEVAKMYIEDVRRIKYPKGETMKQAQYRIIEAWEELLKFDFKKAAIVGHSGTNALLLAYLKDKDIRSIKTQLTGDIITFNI